MKTEKTLARNRRAYFDYELIDEFTAGMELFGHEVKSARNGNVSLKGAYVTLKDHEAWLTNSHIKQYEFANNINSYEPERARKLLLNRSELQKLQKARDEKLTIIPLFMFVGGRHIKLRIATGRGKKLHDKRHSIQTRETNISVQRELKNNNK